MSDLNGKPPAEEQAMPDPGQYPTGTPPTGTPPPPEPPATQHGGPAGHHGGGRGPVRFLKQLIVKSYALVVLAVVVWAGYAAVAYMAKVVFTPSQVPPHFLEWEGRLDTDALRAEQALGINVVAARAPIEHYHTTEPWFQPDPGNNCSTSGCHSPLPHNDSKEIRAFANLHATFMTCEMCHVANAEGVQWIDVPTHEPQGVPELLQLISLLETQTQEIRDEPAVMHAKIMPLLTEIIAGGPETPLLVHLRVQLDTASPGSPVWRQGIEDLRLELPNHARGDYDAKLAPIRIPDRLSDQQQTDLIKTYLASPPEAPAREQSRKQLHQNIVPDPQLCLSCHSPESVRIDWKKLGYTESRAKAIRSTPIANMMEQILKGEPFHLPDFLENAP